ncbi:MAG: Biotin carboxyl carrier protein of acetyl-CoA carboxylase [Chlamydiales bacterium]|nr:Biotin carboxyl carrier protein of acetyl-CoA carboxylase [Chlamydiales bacterium]
MDLKQIEKLMLAMERMKIKRVAFKKDDFEIEIEKESVGAPVQPVHYAPVPTTHEQMAPQPALQAVQEPKKGVFVTSPMVGTFYAASSPEDPSFVKVGDTIEKGSIVCIIEAMKVMNEVKSEVSGKVEEILIKNGEPVEFGTEMFKIT